MKKSKLGLLAIISVLTLSGCEWPFPLGQDNSSSERVLPFDDENGYVVYNATEHNEPNVNYKYLNLVNGGQVLDSIGETKMLVVPVEFSDYPAAELDDANGEEVRAKIEKAFFGEATDTSWESVSSYYEESSYGQLKLTGEVTEWVDLGISTDELDTYVDNKYDHYGNLDENYGSMDATYFVLEKVYEELDADLLNEYDTDKDGYIDAIWLIYSAPNYQNTMELVPIPGTSFGVQTPQIDENIFWAYVFWYYGSEETLVPDANKKAIPGVYAWASYDFMEERYGEEGIDAHTYIHETGHLLGLDDYYDYSGDTSPLGTIDMMDGTLADHNAFSKLALGWIDPIYVFDDADITLKPFHSSGEAILINNNWNRLPFDEYILLEYYQPEGLNEMDSQPIQGFNKGFDIAGVRAYHVDARLVRAVYTEQGLNISATKYVDKIEEPTYTQYQTNVTDIAHSNSTNVDPPRWIVNEQYSLIELLSANTNTNPDYLSPFDYFWNTISSDRVAGNSSLWTTGRGFELLNFNDGSEIGYTIEIGEMNDAGVEIKLRSK